MKKNHRRSQGVSILSGSYQPDARAPKSSPLSNPTGGRRQRRVVINDDSATGAGGIKSPALGVGRARLGDHTAGRIPGDERRGSAEGDAHQARCLTAELGEVEVEADLIEAVGLLDDLSRADVTVDDVDEFLERVARGPTFGQVRVVCATRLGFDDEVEHDVMRQ